MHISPSAHRLLYALLACVPFAGLLVFGTNVAYGWTLGLLVLAVLLSYAAVELRYKRLSNRRS